MTRESEGTGSFLLGCSYLNLNGSSDEEIYYTKFNLRDITPLAAYQTLAISSFRVFFSRVGRWRCTQAAGIILIRELR